MWRFFLYYSFSPQCIWNARAISPKNFSIFASSLVIFFFFPFCFSFEILLFENDKKRRQWIWRCVCCWYWMQKHGTQEKVCVYTLALNDPLWGLAGHARWERPTNAVMKQESLDAKRQPWHSWIILFAFGSQIIFASLAQTPDVDKQQLIRISFDYSITIISLTIQFLTTNNWRILQIICYSCLGIV